MAKKPTNSPEITARKREEGKDLGGRPPFVIDYDRLEKLCNIFCTEEECASILGCSRDTLNLRLKQDYQEAFEDLNAGKGEEDVLEEPLERYNGFQACFKKMSAAGKASLRREQFRMALGDLPKGIKPDKGMLIWLGKNYLEQSDRLDHTTKGDKLPAATGLDLTQLSDEQFKQFGELLKMAREMDPDAEEKPEPKDMH